MADLPRLIDDLADQRVKGAEIIIVSSGAIALGRRTLGLPKGTTSMTPAELMKAVLLAPADLLARCVELLERIDSRQAGTLLEPDWAAARAWPVLRYPNSRTPRPLSPN